jgi:hypothetical protein
VTGKRRFCTYVIILVFFVAGGGALSALGGQEDELTDARQLIAEKRYNEALLILTEVIRKDPDKTEEAENLIRQVRRYRGSYNDRYEELIQVLYQDEDVGRALQIIRELETLDPNPSPATVSALDKARESATFIYEQQQFRTVMEAALALLDQGNYWDASQMYEDAIGLGKEHFDGTGFGNIIGNRVEAIIASVKREAAAFRNARTVQSELLQELKAAASSGDENTLRAALNRYAQVFLPVARTMGVALQAVRELHEQNILVQPDKEDRFLGYTGRLIGGWQASETPEGIKGAAQRLLDDASRPAIEMLQDRAAALIEEGRAAAETEDWYGARDSFAEALRVIDEAARFMNPWYQALAVQGTALSSESWKLVSFEAPLFLGLSTLRAAAESRISLVEALAALGDRNVAAPTSLEELRAFRANLLRQAAPIESLRSDWLAFSNTTGENPLTPPRIQSISRVYKDDLEAWGNRISDLEISAVDRIAAMQLTIITDGVASGQADYLRGTELVRGMQTQVEVSPGVFETRVVHKPSEALTIFSELTARFNTLEASARSFLTTYGNEETRFRSYPGIVQKMTEAQNSIAEIQRLRALLGPSVTTARANVLQAERFKSEGNLRLNETQSAITAGNFEAAHRALALARQSFLNSLALEDDEELRTQSDARLIALDDTMREAENRQVLAEVRSLIDRGRNYYNEGRYEEAETALTRAQLRWQTTQTTEEPEIAYWLGFVRAALFVSSARSILITDPLYNEMNQLLNLAREDYTRAQQLLAEGNRRDALARLTSADEKITQIKKTFPFNQKASVLALQIAFLRDPGNSTAMFRTMFDTARSKIGVNNQEAYSELQDLQQINPNFPGMNQAIYDVEIALRIRIPPPSQRDLAESRRLTQAAYGAVARNETAQFEIALAQVNEALRLDPNNRQAMEIKTRLQDVGGGTVVNVLPASAEEQFRTAQQLFNSQNYFEALAIVQRLLATPAGKNYPPLEELRRRIESQI